MKNLIGINYSVDIFRLGLSCFLLSISVISFVFFRLLHSEHNSLRSYSYSFVFGFLIGLGTIYLPYISLEAFRFHGAFLFLSISLTVMVLSIGDTISIQGASAYQYNRLPTLVEGETPSATSEESELSFGRLEIGENEEPEIQSPSIRRKLYIFSFALITIFFWLDLINCVEIASKEHQQYEDFFSLIIQKITFSVSIPTILNDLKLSDKQFFIHMIILSLSSPLGIALCGFSLLDASATKSLVLFSNQWIASPFAGIIIYISLSYMLPQIIAASEVLSSSKDLRLLQRKKCATISAMIVGYLLSVFPMLI